MNKCPENLDCHRDSWFAGLCRLCGYKVIVTQPDVKRFPTKDYWWYCSNKRCEKHREGQHTGDMEHPYWVKLYSVEHCNGCGNDKEIYEEIKE